MTVYIVIWSACDSGFQMLGAFKSRKAAEFFVSRRDDKNELDIHEERLK